MAGKLVFIPAMFSVGAVGFSAAKATRLAGWPDDFSAWTRRCGMIWFSVVVSGLFLNVYWLPCSVIESATELVIHGTFALVQMGSMARVCELSCAPIPKLTCFESAS